MTNEIEAAAPEQSAEPAEKPAPARHPKPAAAKKAKPAAAKKPKPAPKKPGGKKAKKEAEKARARGWAAAGIGAGIGIGSLAAAMLYANRLRKVQQPSPSQTTRRQPEES